MHHIVSDGWSMGVLVNEIGALYPAFLAGQPSPLPELPVQYPDFALWQRRRLSGAHLEAELDWWRSRLAGMSPVLELPADHPRQAVRSTRGAGRTFLMDPAALSELQALSSRHEATLFMTLLAGFFAVLQRYTGEDDLAVATPIAGRIRTELGPLIGFFVNTLVLRADLGGPEVHRSPGPGAGDGRSLPTRTRSCRSRSLVEALNAGAGSFPAAARAGDLRAAERPA